MEMSFGSRLKHAWNAFTGNIQTNYRDLGMSYSYRADRPRMSRGNERSIVTSVYNRIALDVAALNVQHVRLDENGRFLSVIDDGLNNCLTLEANVDQTARSWRAAVILHVAKRKQVTERPGDYVIGIFVISVFFLHFSYARNDVPRQARLFRNNRNHKNMLSLFKPRCQFFWR